MSYMCPVCNGLIHIDVRCPVCNHYAVDIGKCSDYYDPYSPYRPIDDLKRSNGLADLEHHLCIHLYECPSCSNTFTNACREQLTLQ